MKIPKIPYWYLAATPYILLAIGFTMNAIVMAFNGGQMPVLGGMIDPDDTIHSVMTHATHLKFLADWVVINHVGTASPGDFLEWAYSYTAIPGLVSWIVCLVKDHKPT